MEELAILDQVAYVRFASVYTNFTEPKDFEDFVNFCKESNLLITMGIQICVIKLLSNIRIVFRLILLKNSAL